VKYHLLYYPYKYESLVHLAFDNEKLLHDFLDEQDLETVEVVSVIYGQEKQLQTVMIKKTLRIKS